MLPLDIAGLQALDPAHVKLGDWDINGDGVIDASDCPYPPGTLEAKLWWKKLVGSHDDPGPLVKQGITPAMKAKYGSKVVGAWGGKPLVPGESGPGQGDFDFVSDGVHIKQGLTEARADAVAAKIRRTLYG